MDSRAKAHGSAPFGPSETRLEFLAAHLDELDQLREGPLDLRRLEQLRRKYEPWQATALMQQAELQRRNTKLPGAVLLDEEGLQQASSRELAQRRAARLHALALPGPLLDLGCGIGGDLLELARLRPVIGYEQDPWRAGVARLNLGDLRGEVRCEDYLQAELPPYGAVADPGRRRDGRRLFSPEALEPPLSALLALGLPVMAVKLPPSAEPPSGCAIEYVGRTGECREAVLWVGVAPRRTGAVLLPSGWAEVSESPQPERLARPQPGSFLYEPEPVVLRVRALLPVCEALDAWPIDPQVGYLCGTHDRDHPLAHRFRILEVLDFSLKRVQSRLRALGWGRLEIKKRAVALDPEELRKRLKLAPKGPAGVLLITRVGQKPLALLAQRED